MGTLVAYIGNATKNPPRNSVEAGFTVRVVLQGCAYTEKEARHRVDAFIRRRQLAQLGKSRRRAARKRESD
jgi:hypothetical protein